ncbi:MAG: DNA polymerase I [Clostridia bacterium]|nr:DNA polymerase I [Clostridia bacterium]
MNKTLLVFDGNSIINRAFYAVRPLTTKAGLHTNALFGFLNILKKHLDRVKPTHCAVAFDVHAPTFRHRSYDGYKATRHGMPEELFEQMPYAHRLAELLGLSVLEFEGFEADDILGTTSRLAEKAGMKAFLVTGDRDALQLVSDTTTVLLCTTGQDLEMTPEAIEEKYGLTPAQLIDLKAIMGDSSDNIPGVRGIGEKGALDLMHKAGSLDAVYENLDTLDITAGVKKKLLESKEQAYLSRYLAEILREMDAIPSLEVVRRKEADLENLALLFAELELTRLADKFGVGNLPAAKDAAPAPSDGAQLSLDSLSEATPIAKELEKVSLDEIKEPVFALVTDGRLAVLSGETTGFVAEEDLADFARRFSPIVYDAKPYFHLAAKHGADCETLCAKDDLKLMAYLLDPSGAATSLFRAATVFLSRLVSPSASNEEKVRLVRDLYEILPEKIGAEGMGELYEKIELPLAKILFEMEHEGILIDREALAEYGDILREKMSGVEKRIYLAAGGKLNLNSPKQLGVLLFETLELPHAKKTKTGYSTDAETLEKLRPLSPVVGDILEYRKLQKLHGTYVEALLAQTEHDRRVHTTFLQAQTVTGRLSSQDPNLQNIPVRTPEGREIRRFFVAKEGCVLLDADYSQVELRILAHLSGDKAFLDAFRRGEDIHQKTASEIFHVAPEDVTPEMRKDAKAINFGIVYGIGEYSLSQDLGVSRAKAAEYIQKYFASYPDVKAYLENTVAAAKKTGEVSTLYGRRRFVPELSATKKNLVAFGERVAMNTPIQGTAADIMKLAMVRVADRLKKDGRRAKILLQVHDELLLECPLEEKDAVRSLLKEEMERAAALSLTLTAEVGEGANWLDAK